MSTVMQAQSRNSTDPLIIAGVEYSSRLLVGTGKYKDMEETRAATVASGAEIVTVAIRRSNIGQNADEPNLLDVISPEEYTLLPNTAGCYTAEDAVRTCRLARELLDGHDLVKLEVLGDEKTLFPDIVQTLQATETLVYVEPPYGRRVGDEWIDEPRKAKAILLGSAFSVWQRPLRDTTYKGPFPP